jgi:hypothetical protein
VVLLALWLKEIPLRARSPAPVAKPAESVAAGAVPAGGGAAAGAGIEMAGTPSEGAPGA